MLSSWRLHRIAWQIHRLGNVLSALRDLTNTVSGREFTQIMKDLPMSDAVFLSAIAAELSTLLSGQATATAVAAATAPLEAQITAMQQDAEATSAFVASIRQLLPQIVLTVAEPTVAVPIGGAISATPVTASGGSGAITFSATLPDGVSIDPASGALGGTSAVAVDQPVTITATDAVGNVASASFQLTIS